MNIIILAFILEALLLAGIAGAFGIAYMVYKIRASDRFKKLKEKIFNWLFPDCYNLVFSSKGTFCGDGHRFCNRFCKKLERI